MTQIIGLSKKALPFLTGKSKTSAANFANLRGFTNQIRIIRGKKILLEVQSRQKRESLKK